MPAALFSKIVGMLYKIPLLFIVGVEGMAYFLAAYHVYSLLFVLSATGLPTALSLQISRALARGEDRAVARIFGVSLLLFLLPGLAGSVALLFFSGPLAARLSMGDAAAALSAIAPSLFLGAFIGAGKGYFQGHSRMGPTALCEVLEAAGKLCFGLWLALWAKKQGMEAPAVAAYAVYVVSQREWRSPLFLCSLRCASRSFVCEGSAQACFPHAPVSCLSFVAQDYRSRSVLA